tara:strand:+ start:11646 stop:11750 length:105 start_codon:yes stop_codon:yes gene_type:complete
MPAIPFYSLPFKVNKKKKSPAPSKNETINLAIKK